MRALCFLSILIAALSCAPQPQPEPRQYSVPAEVEPFVQAFREAARQRNQAVVVDNLIVSFGKAQGQDVCGQCLQQANRTPRITLDTALTCWKNAGQQEREALVFHELGHCLLNRDHRADRLPKGQWVSLMNPGDFTIYATCRYPIGNDDCDKRPRRAYYHDELFDPATPAPAWGR
jgi:hypothetical protein